MSYSAATQDDAVESGTPHLSSGGQAQPLSSSLKSSSFNGGTNATPRLLFTWDPYGHVTGGPQILKPPEAADVPAGTGAGDEGEGDEADDGHHAPSRGEDCSTPSSTHDHNYTNNSTTTSAGPVATTPIATAAQPPLTISSLLSGSATGGAGGVNGGGLRSPQLSFNAAAHTPMQHPSYDNNTNNTATASAHSTPSGPVLKRISTTAKDGRQYFLDYSPTTAANANPTGAVGAMPNLMLPPNLSPHSRGVSPLNSALPQSQPSSHRPNTSPQQQQQQLVHPQHQQHLETELLDAMEHRAGSTTTSPQAIPLVSPPRSSSIGGVVGAGAYPYNSLSNHANSTTNNNNNYANVYGTSPQQKPQSSSLLGNSMNSGLLSASVGSAGNNYNNNTNGGMTQHNPYRTSPTFYSMPMSMSMNNNNNHNNSGTLPPPHGTAPLVVQRVQAADLDAELYEVLEATPSLFIKRLLPPPPPLPDVARVLPTPGVVQTLCERWCSFVETVLRSREFSDVTTQPPPPPPIPSPTDTSPTTTTAETEAGKKAAGSAAQEELRAWYNAALEWYEELDQAGASTVDVRASSKAVAWAIEVAASGRGRRGGPAGHNNSNSNGGNGSAGNSRYHGQGGVSGSGRGGGGGVGAAASNYRGGAYGGFPGSSNPYSSGRGGGVPSAPAAAMGGYRGMRGGAGSAGPAPYYNSSVANSIRGMAAAAAEMEAAANNSGNTRNTAYAPSNFNPYAESWTFSGETHLAAQDATPLPPPPMPSATKPSYLAKVPSPSQQGYAVNPAMGQM